MILIVGLGNPGKEYENTPHNMGQFCVEGLFADLQGSSEWKLENDFSAMVATGTLFEKRVMLALPQTFMNNSGVSVAAMANFYKLQPENVWVLHDDIDIALANVRVALGGSSAGHYGIESIMEKLGTANFWRFRVGIAPASPLTMPLEAYVLKKNAINDEEAGHILAKARALVSLALEQGADSAGKASD